MARVTVEDCLDKVPNRFALVILAAERARVAERTARVERRQHGARVVRARVAPRHARVARDEHGVKFIQR